MQMMPPGARPPTGGFPPSMPPSGAMTPGVVPTCKLPGCSKPCYVEKGGRVHDFCGKNHAALYQKTKPQQGPMQAAQPTTAIAVLYKPASSLSTMMIVSQQQQPTRAPDTTICAHEECRYQCDKSYFIIHRTWTTSYGTCSKY